MGRKMRWWEVVAVGLAFVPLVVATWGGLGGWEAVGLVGAVVILVCRLLVFGGGSKWS